jgi:predicted permease
MIPSGPGIWIILVCLGLGIGLGRLKSLPANSARALGFFVLHVPLPALILLKMHELIRGGAAALGLEGAPDWRQLALPISLAWIQFPLALVFAWGVGRAFKLKRGTVGALALTAGLGNTSFVGYSLLEALRGKGAIPIAILVDQPGSFLVFATVGVLTAARFSGAKVTLGQSLKRAFTFAPFLSFVAALVTSPWAFSDPLRGALDGISGALIPTALVSVGMQLRLDRAALARRGRELAAGLIFKLLLMPALMAAICLGVLRERGLLGQVVVLEAGMATMISAAIVAADPDLDPELAGLMVGVGIPLSLVTVSIWAALI